MKLSQLKARWLLPILTFVLCLSTGRAAAQTVPVTLKMDNTSLEQVLNAIEKQTSYLFVYDKAVDASRKVSVDADKTPLKSVLDQILKPFNLNYAVNNTSIVISAAPAVATDGPVTVTGHVVDAAGEPVLGAAVTVKGTTIGFSTGIEGEFTLQVPAPASSAVLAVSYLGYEPAEIAVGNRTDFTITLVESSIGMDEVVVTALGIKRSEKALSYNAVQVKADDVVRVKDANFVNSLNGKVAGLNINSSSSGIGGASKVVMRGAKSIEQSSNALYVIDGVPMINFNGEGGSEFASGGTTEAIADINPEDIESISVLAGAAAAALYGSDAANGAIVITTKKGSAGFTSLTVSSNTELLDPFIMPSFQNRYGTGDLSTTSEVIDRSWGNRLNDANYYGYNPSDDYFQRGVIGTETVSLSTGTERNQTYVSAGAVNSKGVIPNNKYDRYNFTFRNTTSFLNDKMKLDVGASYILQKDRNMTNQGVYNNPLVSAYLFPRGNDWEAIKMYERYDSGRKIYTQYWPSGAGSYVMQNPYWVNYRNLRENKKDRYMLSAQLSYDILDWLNVSGRIRVDNTNNTYTEKYYATTNTLLTEGSNNGLFGIARSIDKSTYGDVLININKTFCQDFSLQANIGASFSDLRSDNLLTRGPIAYGLQTGYDADGNPIYEPNNIPNVFNTYQLSASKTTHEQTGWQEQTQSVFASVELGYKGAYYLTVTGRNDWPSQLAGPNSVNKSFFYPSVGGSVVFSEIFDMPVNLSYLKLRASYASVGLAFSRFLANPTREWKYATNTWSLKGQYPLYNLKPERTESVEVGITARFLKHFNLDFTFYNTNTKNQTFNPLISPSSQYENMYIQSGNVRNRGVELSLGYKNTWNKFTWNSNFTFSANRNKIISLAEDAVNPINGQRLDIDHLDVGGLGNVRYILQKGGSLGDMYARADLKRDSNGDIYIDEAGEIQIENISNWKDYIKLGSVFPKANMAWRNDFNVGNFGFGFLISARLGGIVYSRTQAVLDYYGVSEASAAARDAGGIVINGGDLIDANRWYSTIGVGDTAPIYYTYSATNVRLQEASISYTIPRKWLGNALDITVSLVGRNLWMIYNKAPFDPEAVATTGNYYQGIDYFMMPNTRNIGFNIRFKF